MDWLTQALERAWALSRGQPWLVNALGYETCFELPAGRDRSQPITAERLDEAKEALAAAARVVHTGECSMMEPHLDALSAAARFLSFDFSERDWDYVEAHAPHADLAILSRPERSSDDPLEVAARVLELGPTQVVVSSGAKGALWADRTRHLHAAAPDARVVDTLGAGDSLIARLLVGIVEGETPDVWLPAATAYATAACMERGAFGHAASLTPNAPPSNTSERQE